MITSASERIPDPGGVRKPGDAVVFSRGGVNTGRIRYVQGYGVQFSKDNGFYRTIASEANDPEHPDLWFDGYPSVTADCNQLMRTMPYGEIKNAPAAAFRGGTLELWEVIIDFGLPAMGTPICRGEVFRYGCASDAV